MTAPAVNERTWKLLNILADGRFHSGEILASELGISRSSVFMALDAAAALGIALQRVRGRGYRLTHPWQQLNLKEVLHDLGKNSELFNIEILQEASSSNSLLLKKASSGAPSGSVLVIELQTAGRGRMGKIWYSGLGNALTFSLLWRFECGLNALSGLSLAVGVAVVRALVKLGGQNVQLKWPNDIMVERGKLGGILIEAQGDMLGPSAVVIGIGLNYTLPDHLGEIIDHTPRSLDSVFSTIPPRNQLLAAILTELATMLTGFVAQGFGPFSEEWEQYHAFQNQPIKLKMPGGQVESGVALGVSKTGELCVETVLGVKRFNSGEVGGRDETSD